MEIKNILNYAPVWSLFRWFLDAIFGVYRKRIDVLTLWGLVTPEAKILDVACGTGQYSEVFQGEYLGVDLNAEYIKKARLMRINSHSEFRCMDVIELVDCEEKFDHVLLIGIVHHLDESTVLQLLTTVSMLAEKTIVIMEPIKEQKNLIGRWFINNDRGEYIRESEVLNKMIISSGLKVLDEKILCLGPIRTVASLWRPSGYEQG